MLPLTAGRRAARRAQEQQDLDHLFYDLFRQAGEHLAGGRVEEARSPLRAAETRARSAADRPRRTIARPTHPAPTPYFDSVAFAAFVVLDYENLRQLPGRPWPARVAVDLAPATTDAAGLHLADRIGIATLHRDAPTLTRYAVGLISAARSTADPAEQETARALALAAWGLADGFSGTSATSAMVAAALQPPPGGPAPVAPRRVTLHAVRSR